MTRVIILEADANLDASVRKLNKELALAGEEIISTSPAGNKVLVTVRKIQNSNLNEVPNKGKRILLDGYNRTSA